MDGSPPNGNSGTQAPSNLWLCHLQHGATEGETAWKTDYGIIF